MVPRDLPGVPRVPISGPNRGIFLKLIGPGPLESGGHSHASFSNGRFRALENSFHIDVIDRETICDGRFFCHLESGSRIKILVMIEEANSKDGLSFGKL